MIQSLHIADTYLQFLLAVKFLWTPISSVASEGEYASLLANGSDYYQTTFESFCFSTYNFKPIGFNSINLKRPDKNVNDKHQQIIQLTDEDESSENSGSDSDEY